MDVRDTLEQRLQRIEDVEALRYLEPHYSAHCDAGYDAEPLALSSLCSRIRKLVLQTSIAELPVDHGR